MSAVKKQFSIPQSNWGIDHYRVLEHVKSVCEQHGGYLIQDDPFMEASYLTKKFLQGGSGSPQNIYGITTLPIGTIKSVTLKDGTVLKDYDDWQCLIDLAQAGFFSPAISIISPGQVLVVN